MRIFCLLSSVIILILAGITAPMAVEAQTAGKNFQALITWTANNYYPADYQGKAWATTGSLVALGVELVINNRLQDLRSAQTTWYLDGKFLGRGPGLKQASFLVSKSNGENHFIRLVIDLSGKIYESSINIPVNRHLASLNSSYPNKFIPANNRVRFEIIPYFFNVTALSDLLFGWTINGQYEERKGNNELAINIGGIDELKIIDVSGAVQNTINPLEFDTDKKRFNVY